MRFVAGRGAVAEVLARGNVAAKKDAHIYYLGVAKAEYRSCELANPAQVRQIASQTGVLFSAG